VKEPAVRGYWRIIVLGLLLAMLATGTLACAKRNTTASGSNNGGGGGGAGGGGAVIRTQIPDPTALTATLAPEGGGQAAGTVEFAPGSPGTKVTVNATGLTPGKHVGFIYHGSCEGAGEKHGPLTEIEAGADGAGTATTNFVSFALVHFIEEVHFIAIHAGDAAAPGAVVSCGEIKNAS
jgi:hypothetical protein